MAQNPFLIDQGSFMPGVSMLARGMQVGQAKDERAAALQRQQDRQQAISSAYQAAKGNPEAMLKLQFDFPEVSKAADSAINYANQKTRDLGGQMLAELLTTDDPAKAAEITERYSGQILDAGGSPQNLGQSIIGLRSDDPEAAARELSDLKDVMILTDKTGVAKSWIDQQKDRKGPSIGQYNPRDYTVDSFSKFVKSGDPSALERYTEKTIMVGDVPHMLNTSTQKYEPLKTAKEIGGDKAEIESQVTLAREEAKAEAAKIVSQQGQFNKLEQADEVYKSLRDADLSKIYGKGESMYPDLIRSQDGIDMLSKRDQLVGMLTLAARGELKGQGPITEGEQGMLSKAASVLSNQNISSDLAKKELDSAMKILYQGAGQEFDPMEVDDIGGLLENPSQDEYDSLSVGDEYIYNGKRYRKK